MEDRGPVELLRNQLAGRVRKVLTGQEANKSRALVSDNALFQRDTPIRLVHADIVGMMIGGVRSLLLQMLHPHALQGVMDHSNFREDMHGRLRRTASFIAVTTFGHRNEAYKAIARVNQIHTRVEGILPDGQKYSARDPRVLAWVHVAEATSFLATYLRYVRPVMSSRERDEYFRQFAIIASALGADPVPENQREAELIFRELRQDLHSSPEAREIARLVLDQRPKGAPPFLQTLMAAEAIEILPHFARSMLGLKRRKIAAFPAHASTWTMGKTLRWAFKQNRPQNSHNGLT